MSCNDCVHKLVCRYKEEYNKLQGLLPATEIPFKTKVECSYFKDDAQANAFNQFRQAIESQQKTIGVNEITCNSGRAIV